jgi:omega-6 fatty acid desaturase (delta-12 desaturase)
MVDHPSAKGAGDVGASGARTGRRRAPPQTWQREVARYAHADNRKAVWQVVNTFVPYLGLWALMVYTVQQGLSYWITLALAVVAALLLVRIFIFFHDCGHGSFFSSPRANTLLGYVSGILTFTPYHDWRHAHAIHHATAGNLDRRGVGDVWTMTVEEYRSASQGTRLGYRLIRNPLVMFSFGPAWSFLVRQRWPRFGARRSDVTSVIITDVAIAAIIVAASLTIGLDTYLLIQLPVILIAGVLGLWLFYVQHQYEGVYWARDGQWDATQAALEGSSYYKLPKVLQWFTGNIGLHHIHHLRPRIPNYRLQACYDAVPAMQAVKPLTFRESLKSLRMNLWDEEQQKLVSFRMLSASPDRP